MESIINGLEKGVLVKMPTRTGEFSLIPFKEGKDGPEHIVLIKGNTEVSGTVLTRIHSACATGDLFGSLRCDCGEQLKKSMQMIEENGSGIIVYMQQEGRGIGLMDKIKAYKLQEGGLDTVEANVHLGYKPDERNYAVCAEILKQLNVSDVRLITNNPAKIMGLEEYGIRVADRVPIVIEPNEYSFKYLYTKQKKMNHLLKEEVFANK